MKLNSKESYLGGSLDRHEAESEAAVTFQQLSQQSLHRSFTALGQGLFQIQVTEPPKCLLDRALSFCACHSTKQLQRSSHRKISFSPTICSALKGIGKCNLITSRRWKYKINAPCALRNFKGTKGKPLGTFPSHVRPLSIRSLLF